MKARDGLKGAAVLLGAGGMVVGLSASAFAAPNAAATSAVKANTAHSAVLSGCEARTTGQLRVLNGTHQSCRANEIPISWNVVSSGAKANTHFVAFAAWLKSLCEYLFSTVEL